MSDQLPLPLGLEWDEVKNLEPDNLAISQVVGDEDDDFLAGVPACGMNPEECEACT